jgi:hypothetical protein
MKRILPFLSVAILCPLFSSAFNVTFRLDMNTQSGFTTPEVNGTFNNWCGNCFVMTDENADGIWEASVDLAAGTYEYKFSADNWGTQENLIAGSACTVTNSGFTNRSLVVEADVVLPVVCWSSCVDCQNTPNIYQVTFQVDMSDQSGFTTPEVNGTFNSWCGNCTAMSDTDGDQIWTVVVSLSEGFYEFKYSYDNWAGQESLAAGSECTITTGAFTNRTLNVSSDTTLEAVCFGSCAACGIVQGPFNILFELDMTYGPASFTTPEINGTFNNWCGNCAPLSDADGDGIWSTTIPLDAGTYQYKFSYDNWAGQEELNANGTCVSNLDGFINRQIVVEGPASAGVVCWQTCEPCVVAIEETTSSFDLQVYPNPVIDQLVVNSNNQEAFSVMVYDAKGALIYLVSSKNQSQISINSSTWNAGIYTVLLSQKDAFKRVSIVKN